MSNPLAIQAVTQTLREMLSTDDAIEAVSIRPPDRLLDTDISGRLNLYLYRVAPNAAWQNSYHPERDKGSERSFPPLALDLFYLLTAYGDDSEKNREHELLGRAMHIFHNNASIPPAYIRRATSSLAAGELVSDLHEQIERVRITHDPLTVDDLSKLWNTFQTQYRISTAYRVSVVLIDSTKHNGSAMPVLRRGSEDRGPHVFASLEPRITEVLYHDAQQPELPQQCASIGSKVTLKGVNLPSSGLSLTIRDPRIDAQERLDANILTKVTPLPMTTTGVVEFVLEKSFPWPGGIYTVDASFEAEELTRSSQPVPIAIAPQIRTRIDGRPIATVLREGTKIRLQLELENAVPENRQIYLILNGQGHMYQFSRDRRAREDSNQAPVFLLKNVASGRYRVRVRIEGVDSQVTVVRDPGSRFS